MRSDSVFWIVFVLNYDTGFIALYSFRVLFPYVHYMTVWVCELLRSWPWLTLSLNKVKIKELRAVCLSLCQRSPCQQRGLRHHEEKRWGTHTHTHTLAVRITSWLYLAEWIHVSFLAQLEKRHPKVCVRACVC